MIRHFNQRDSEPPDESPVITNSFTSQRNLIVSLQLKIQMELIPHPDCLQTES